MLTRVLSSLSLYWLYLLVFAGLGGVFIYLSQQAAIRVGDGSEYYALYYAWADTFRPWMTDSAFAHYQALVDTHLVEYMPSLQHVMEKFPELRIGKTADFNHFWFYSFLAFLVALPFNAVGLGLQVHHSFLLLHFVLLMALFVVFIRLYGRRGLAVAFIMTLLSPMLWYLDKVHTELLTVVLCMLAVACVHRRFYLAGSFFFAMASTQNPSFALVAFLPFCYRILIKRREALTLFEVVLTLGTAILVLLHPTYYFFRYGVVTPQLLTMGADLGLNLSIFYIWLLDPDVGLLPFWPIGMLILGLCFYFRFIEKPTTTEQDNRFFILFMMAFLAINLYAHSSTENLNSGAGAGPARYALWYLPLFVPLLVYVLKHLDGHRVLALVCVVLLGGNTWYNFAVSAPSNKENLPYPSAFSTFVQSNLSRWYSPHPEIFIEKFGGYGEEIGQVNPLAIIGPDCAKTLVIPGGGRNRVLAPASCFFDQGKISDVLQTVAASRQDTQPYYIRLTGQQVDASELELSVGEYLVGIDQRGNAGLASGWSGIEATGVWSIGSKAVLSLPCSEKQFYFQQDVLRIRLQLTPFGRQSIEIKHQQKTLYKGDIEAAVDLEVEVAPEQCSNSSIELELHIAAPKSPFEMGMSEDRRKLGIWLSRYSLH